MLTPTRVASRTALPPEGAGPCLGRPGSAAIAPVPVMALLVAYNGTAVVAFTRSITKLVLQSCTLGCLSSVSMMKLL